MSPRPRCIHCWKTRCLYHHCFCLGPHTADAGCGAPKEANGRPNPRPFVDDLENSLEHPAGCWNKGPRRQGMSYLLCSYQLFCLSFFFLFVYTRILSWWYKCPFMIWNFSFRELKLLKYVQLNFLYWWKNWLNLGLCLTKYLATAVLPNTLKSW